MAKIIVLIEKSVPTHEDQVSNPVIKAFVIYSEMAENYKNLNLCQNLRSKLSRNSRFATYEAVKIRHSGMDNFQKYFLIISYLPFSFSAVFPISY